MPSSALTGILYVVLVVILLPLLLIWTLLGFLFTIPPDVCSTLALSIITLLFLFSEFLYFSDFLLLEYILFLPVIVFAFQYRKCTKLFRHLCCGIIFALSLGLTIVVNITSANVGTHIVSFITLCAVANISVVSLNIWVPTSDTSLLKAQETVLALKCDRKVVHLMVAGLGTIQVLDEYKPEDDEETEVTRLTSSHDTELHTYYHGTSKIDRRPVLVLVHGYGGSNGDWAGCLSMLQQRFRVYCVELCGFGRSVSSVRPGKWPGRTIDQSFSLFCTALERWRVSMQIEERMVLLGHSLGAHIVSAYAMGYPEHVQHVILASPIGIGVPRGNQGSRHSSPDDTLPCLSRWSRWVGEALWEYGWTPQDVLRWLGPVGPLAIRRLFQWKEQILRRQIAAASALQTSCKEDRNWTPITSPLNQRDMYAAAELAYQHLARPPYGERCLRVFLHMSGDIKRPLVTWLGSSAARNRSSKSRQSCPLNDSAPSTTTSLLRNGSGTDSPVGMVTAWGRGGYGGRGLQQGATKVSILYGMRGVDFVAPPIDTGVSEGRAGQISSGRHPTSELVSALQIEGIQAAAYEVTQAGHILHMDNPQEFALTVIQAHFTPSGIGKDRYRKLTPSRGAVYNGSTAINDRQQTEDSV